MTPLIDIVVNFCMGAAFGVAGGMLGIGGGLVAIPVLGLLYGMDQHLAQGTALVMIAPNVLLSLYRYHQKHAIDLRSAALASAFSIGAAWFAARFAVGLDAGVLHLVFALFLVALALFFGWPARRATGVAVLPPTPVPARVLPVIGAAAGAVSGFFTVGGALVVVPVLVKLWRMPQTRAQGLALALVVPSAFVALGTYAHSGHVDWQVGLPMAVGGVLTVSWGVHLAHTLAPRVLRWTFSGVMLGTALLMLATGH